MGKTTVKPISLGYRDVGSSGDYTKLMGVLKGLSINQDEPESTEIEAEFYDSPFDIFYDGNPVTMTFELANYDLSELEELFGGDYDSVNDEYEGAANAFTSEHEWKLNFGRGYASLVLYKGLTIGTIKKDADGALNYSVTITALIHTTGTGTEQDPYVEHMYKIVSTPAPAPALTMLRVDTVEGLDEGEGSYNLLLARMSDGSNFLLGYADDAVYDADSRFDRISPYNLEGLYNKTFTGIDAYNLELNYAADVITNVTIDGVSVDIANIPLKEVYVGVSYDETPSVSDETHGKLLLIVDGNEIGYIKFVVVYIAGSYQGRFEHDDDSDAYTFYTNVPWVEQQ